MLTIHLGTGKRDISSQISWQEDSSSVEKTIVYAWMLCVEETNSINSAVDKPEVMNNIKKAASWENWEANDWPKSPVESNEDPQINLPVVRQLLPGFTFNASPYKLFNEPAMNRYQKPNTSNKHVLIPP